MTTGKEGATGTQADPGTQPPAGDAKSQADDAGESQSESISLEEARKLRSEAAGLRRRLKEFEDRASKEADERLSENEKALAQARKEGATEAIGKAREIMRRSEVRRALAASGCQDVEIAAMAPEFGLLEVSDEGTVEGLDKAVATFRTGHPALFVKPVPAGGAEGGTRGQPASTRTSDDLLRAALRGH
jgi:hypothetical protein